ncbi:hypothetical protein MMA231_04219 (plasmid) [Asticcacaulis sp. MM231]|uniref:tetratricopeptide repeat protein n=1 Tax=Asticcacaulis sp. MM231 TaxID=3157666 RepID=UPI0032D58866
MNKIFGVRVIRVAFLVACFGGCLGSSGFAADTPPPVKKDKPFKERAEALHAALTRRVGSGDTEAMVYLATLKEQGDDAETADLAGAFDLYERAGARGNPDAVKKMCLAYLLGEGRPKDVVKASGFCNRIDSKDAVTFFWGGYDYQHGLSGPKDITSAEVLYQQAYENGSGEAADAIGQLAFDGGHLDAARSWYRKGAALGSIDAMDHLAAMVEQGQGGVKDTVEAAWLYGLAAQRGHTHAAAWMAAHPGAEAPLVCLANETSEVSLVHTYGRDRKSETLTSSRITSLLRTNLGGMPAPGNNLPYYYAYFECYIGTSRDVDLCVATREFPAARNINRILHAVWDGRISTPEYDVAGNRMAQSRFKAGVAIVFPD